MVLAVSGNFFLRFSDCFEPFLIGFVVLAIVSSGACTLSVLL